MASPASTDRVMLIGKAKAGIISTNGGEKQQAGDTDLKAGIISTNGEEKAHEGDTDLKGISIRGEPSNSKGKGEASGVEAKPGLGEPFVGTKDLESTYHWVRNDAVMINRVMEMLDWFPVSTDELYGGCLVFWKENGAEVKFTRRDVKKWLKEQRASDATKVG